VLLSPLSIPQSEEALGEGLDMRRLSQTEHHRVAVVPLHAIPPRLASPLVRAASMGVLLSAPSGASLGWGPGPAIAGRTGGFG
jgi:hypothetical protein